MSLTQVLSSVRATPCPPSTVSKVPPSVSAKLMPPECGVAGSRVTDTIKVLGKPSIPIRQTHRPSH
ncbi:MAG: hypothetical protein WBA43_24770 [Elainellaceae cyanobacterium]